MVNKKCLQIILPDGPHWYAGIATKKGELNGQVASITAPLWSPYWDEVVIFDVDKDADIAAKALNMAGIQAVYTHDALYSDSRERIEGGYKMRAKYLQRGMRVTIPGSVSQMFVWRIDNRYIHLKHVQGNGPRKSIGKKSDRFVIVSEKGEVV
jgi:hypothetical protein